ncbi:hypothetical protein FOVG_15896 [Fusarium oxysporum f. sp. pisi HDV247]|uniref:Metallo-beta-lactamase domain-containing protein n=1 Tax=Fusarium oxysporum f. sp. pisi HDV247 TaxID=1080344 RepID=W9NJJ5_FUSOX|nr:hypothetical protein FOVG_15896 [Fusarium oxysporum f. sp. pisi HDV247]
MFTKSLLMSLLLAGTAIKGCEACGSCVEPRHAGDEGNSSARSLIHDAIKALGGRQSLHNLHGVTYESPEILRVSTLMQNYNLFHSDRYVVSHGSQNISYSFSDTMAQRIDRNYQLSDYFFFGTPSIPPVQFSLVMKSGPEGYACYTEGNDFVFVPGNVTTGYTDSALADYLLFQAQKMSPRLLLDIERHRLQSVNVDINGVPFPAVHDKDLDLTVAFNLETKLPFVFRSFEDHAIFGRTENDLRLFNYKEVNGIMFPTQRLVVQNGTSVLEQTTFAKVIPNPKFPDDFFDGLDEDKSATPRVPPSKIDGYSHAEIGEYWTNALWGGPYAGTYDNLTSETLGEDLPNAHRLLVENNPVVEHLVLDFEDGVIVYEAPPHQTDLVIRWVKENLKKPITHIFPTHHHHDHNYDIHKYVELGAKIIAPEVGAPYWKQIPGAEIITFTEEEPFIYSDDTMQARFIWHSEAPHAADWSYSIVTTKCPTANSTMLAYEADAFSTLTHFDTQLAYGWLNLAVLDGMSRNTTVVPTHGRPVPLSVLLDQIDYVYPPFDSTDLRVGGQSCVS